MRSHLLGPFERRVKRPCPAYRHMRLGLIRSPDVVILQLLSDRNIDTFNRCHIERGAECRALSTGTIVSANENDECVVELAQILHSLNHTANFIVCISDIGSKDIRLPDEKFLFIGTKSL